MAKKEHQIYQMLFIFMGWQRETFTVFLHTLAVKSGSLISLQAPPLNGKGQTSHQACCRAPAQQINGRNARFFTFPSFLTLKTSTKTHHENDPIKPEFFWLLLMFPAGKFEARGCKDQQLITPNPTLPGSLAGVTSSTPVCSAPGRVFKPIPPTQPSHNSTSTKVWELPLASYSANATSPASAPVSF